LSALDSIQQVEIADLTIQVEKKDKALSRWKAATAAGLITGLLVGVFAGI